MRGSRLKGWQRIGIVLSVVWAIVGGTWGWKHAHDKINEDFKACVRAFETPSDLQACRETRFRAIAVPRGYTAALVALAPVTFVWLLAYALVALVRWIRGQVSNPRLDARQVGYMPDKARLDVVTDTGSIADYSFDRDKFVAELDGLSKYEIEARIRLGILGSKEAKAAQEYFDQHALAFSKAAQADRVEIARSAKNAAWVAAIFAAIAALAAVIALLR